jgi:hypothetical protein
VGDVDVHHREEPAVARLGHDRLGVEDGALGRRRVAGDRLGHGGEEREVGARRAEPQLGEAVAGERHRVARLAEAPGHGQERGTAAEHAQLGGALTGRLTPSPSKRSASSAPGGSATA